MSQWDFCVTSLLDSIFPRDLPPFLTSFPTSHFGSSTTYAGSSKKWLVRGVSIERTNLRSSAATSTGSLSTQCLTNFQCSRWKISALVLQECFLFFFFIFVVVTALTPLFAIEPRLEFLPQIHQVGG